MERSQRGWLALAALLSAVVGCGPAHDGESPDETSSSLAVGVVLDGAGSGVPSVTVEGGGRRAVSDSTGRFELSVARNGSTLLTFEHAGRAPTYRSVRPDGAPVVTVSAVMLAPTLVTQVDVRGGSARVAAGNARLTFPRGSIVTADGSPTSGPVDVAVTVVDAAEAAELSPAPLVGTDGEITEPLVSFGMIDVTLSHQGARASVARGEAVALEIPSAPGDPAEAGLWTLDPERGVWVLEGSARNAGDHFGAELPHFSWWNIDNFLPRSDRERACVIFELRAADGSPFSGGTVEGRFGPSERFSLGGSTNGDGRLCIDDFPLERISPRYRVFLSGTSQHWVEGAGDPFQPTAVGVRCGQTACQRVVMVVACTNNAECASGQTCQAGSCTGISEPNDDPTLPGDPAWVGGWELVSLDGVSAAELGVMASADFTRTAFTTLVSDGSASCRQTGTLTFDGDQVTVSLVMSSCQAGGLGETATFTFTTSNGGNTLTITGGGSTEVYARR